MTDSSAPTGLPTEALSAANTSAAETALSALLSLMAKLRSPDGGCPWDQAQSFATIAPFTIEEAYEVADAISPVGTTHGGSPGGSPSATSSGNPRTAVEQAAAPGPDWAALQDELGDLLFQVVYYAQMGAEAGHFDFASIAHGITTKMIHRHPHVFGDAAARAAGMQAGAWEAGKVAERARRAETGTLAGIPVGLPSLTRALKLTRRAARVGFDWPDAEAVFEKMDEEVAELRAEMPAPGRVVDRARLADEMGDLLFVMANLARKLDLDPEACLRGANAKFSRRFGAVEAALAAEGRSPQDATLAEMEAGWVAAKRTERGG